MTQPHIPAWLEDVVAHLVAAYEAEAAFLVGAQARGQETPATDFEILVIVDNERAPERGLPPRYRWESLDGFPGPVRYLRASLAELMAGAYGVNPRWLDLLAAAHPLHDPLDYRRRLDAQRSAARTPASPTLLASIAAEADDAERFLASGLEAAAHLAALRAADELVSWIAQEDGHSPYDLRALSQSIANLSPGVARAFAETLQAEDARSRLDALRRLVAAVDATLRLKD